MGIGSNRSRTGKPATLCELRTRMRDLDQSSRITIPASGFWKCRIKRPDRRAHSIPSSYGKFSSCIAGGNHRREISVLPPNPFRAFGVNSKTLQMPAARPHGRSGVRRSAQAGGPPWPLPTARSASKRRTPCQSMSVGPQGPVRQHGRGTATEPEARVPAAQCRERRTRRSAPHGARDRVRQF